MRFLEYFVDLMDRFTDYHIENLQNLYILKVFIPLEDNERINEDELEELNRLSLELQAKLFELEGLSVITGDEYIFGEEGNYFVSSFTIHYE